MSEASARASAIGGAEFRVGRVLSRSLTVLFRSFPKYLLFGIVMAVPNFFSAKPLIMASPADWPLPISEGPVKTFQ